MTLRGFALPRLIKWLLLNAALILVLMTLYRLFLYLRFRPSGMPISGKSFLLGLRYDARVAAVILLPVFLLASVKYFSPARYVLARRIWLIYLKTALVLLLLFFAADYQWYVYRNVRLDAEMISYMEDAGISLKMVWQSYPVIKILLLMAVFIFVIHFTISRIYRSFYAKMDPVTAKKKRLPAGILFFLLLALVVYGRIGQFPLRWSDAASLNNDFKANMALNPVQSFFSSLKFRNEKPNVPLVKELTPLLSRNLQLPLRADTLQSFDRRLPAADSGRERPNVVVVLCESFSWYKTSMAGNPLNPTPYFDSLRRHGAFFTRCFSPAYGTARGVWATLTGIPDVTFIKTASRNPRAVDQHTIVNDFKGYEKFYFIGGSASWANIRGLIKNNIEGLKLYEEQDYSSPKVDVWGISDHDLFMESDKVLRQQRQPFFAVIQTANNHRPYTIPRADAAAMGLERKPLDSLLKYGFNVERDADKTNGELNAMRYMDYCIRRFMETARQQPYFSNTVFLFIGDHGIRGNGGPLVPQAFTDKGLTCQHVPMLVYAPGRVAPVQHDFACSQVDVLPTVAGLAGIGYRNTTLGRDLFAVARDSSAPKFAFILDFDTKTCGIVEGDYYYLRDIKGKKEEMVYIGNGPAPASAPAGFDYKGMTNAVYETSRWWLFNNKKPAVVN